MKHYLPASLRLLFIGGILMSFFAGCSVLDPAEQIPSYLHIDGLKLNSVGQIQGSSSATITDAWVYMDGTFLGAFQLPCTIPILNEGTHDFIIKGGVLMNGLVSTRAIYPYWKGWEGNVTLTRGKVKSIGTQPLYYFSGTDFVWSENFDAQGCSLVNTQGTVARLVQDSVGAFETRSGHIFMNQDTSIALFASSQPYSIPPQTDVYVEFDYRCDVAFSVGIIGVSDGASHPWLTIDPSPTWKKIYIRLTDVLADQINSSTDQYYIYFASKLDMNASQANIYLDNIKLLK